MLPLTSRSGTLLALLVFTSLMSPRAEAQPPRREPTPNDTLKSTEVGPDHKVTFRIFAPKAEMVSLSGDFAGAGKMTKDDKGVWSHTVGPLTPDFYTYSFNVDGVRTIDPKNAMIKQGINSLDSMFLVPGPEAEFETTSDVPHGVIHIAWYRSGTLDAVRSMHVYTPPGYDGGAEKYPVFYLLHGAGDDDSGWSTIGRAGFILDNLVAANKVVPMIVVMPNGSLPRPASMPRFEPGTAPSPEAMAAFRAAQGRFTNELLKEVVPYVVKPGQENRALAGLSMGGGQTFQVIASHPDEFAYVGVWSGAVGGGRNGGNFEERYEPFLKSADHLNKVVKLFSISVGDHDFLLNGSKSLDEAMEKHGIKHEMHISGGGHTWINWRHYLNDFAPRLFR
jgi:enterochelin esterase-like enzyme